MPNYQGIWKISTQYQNTVGWPAPISSFKAAFGGGNVGGNVVDYIIIPTTGNAADWGDLTSVRAEIAANGNAVRGVWIGGSNSNVMDYITWSSQGNAVDFGDILSPTNQYDRGAGCGNATRGLFGGGEFEGSGVTNTIQYITFATTGNATDFGDRTFADPEVAACSSSTRGVFAGGDEINIIDYVTISSTGNATDFGDLRNAQYAMGGCSSSTRGLFGGGRRAAVTEISDVDYITIASTGNSALFGNLGAHGLGTGAVSSETRGVFGGGRGTETNNITYVTINTLGDGTDFGDLTVARNYLAGASACHGGLSA